ncbi:MAG TPA: efflux RND transporter periplasmic adaptor subunit [Thermoanaerobaculia bacterium]
MKLKKRQIGYGVAALVILIITVMALLPDPVPVDTAAVERGAMSVTIESRGETRVVDRFVITAPVSGTIQRIDLREGAQIDAGQVVARIVSLPIDPRQREEGVAHVAGAEATRREAAAAVATAEAAWGLARRERERIESLAGEGVAAGQTLDQARIGEERSRREVEAARQRLQAATSNLAAARAAIFTPEQSGTRGVLEVRSPVAGRLFRIPERSERIVSAGTPILEIGDARQLELVIDVLSEDAVRIRTGNRVVVDQWGGDRPLHGTVRLVEPSAFQKISALGIEEQRVNVIADLTDPPAELGDAYRVEARIVVWESERVLKVPVSALARIEQQWSVFVVEDGRARRQPVEIGRRNPLEAEVVKGLEEGAIVIVHPSFEIGDGVRVRG